MADAWGGTWGTSWGASWFGAQAPTPSVGRYLPRGGAALNEEQREYWRRMREEAGQPAFEPPPHVEAPTPPKAARKAKQKPKLEAPLDGRVLESVRNTVAKIEARKRIEVERKRRELEEDDEDVLLLIA